MNFSNGDKSLPVASCRAVSPHQAKFSDSIYISQLADPRAVSQTAHLASLQLLPQQSV